MRFLSNLLPVLGMVTWAATQQYTYAPTNSTIFQLSSDPELAFLLEEVLALAPAEGSATGEILRIATEIIPGDIHSWYPAFYWFAEQMNALAESIDPSVDPAGARETYFRASTYYRQSVFLLVGNPSDPRLYSVWNKQLAAFAKAIALLEPAPGEHVSLRAENSSIGPFDIPGYFFKGRADNESVPTIIVGSGYDGPQQDIYHLACGEILKRGLNCMLYEGPGQPTCRRQGHGFIPDWWSVVTPVVDYLYTRPDVDTSKIALLGDSFGGLLAPLAASKEHRLSALILLDGLPNFRQDLIWQYPPALVALYNESKVAEFNEAVFSSMKNASYGTSYRVGWDYTLWATDEKEPYAAWTRLGKMKWGLETAAEIGKMPVFVAKGQDDTLTLNQPELARHYLETGRPNGKNLTHYHEFLTSLGAGEHTSLGAESQVYVKILGWLSNVWGGYKFGNTN